MDKNQQLRARILDVHGESTIRLFIAPLSRTQQVLAMRFLIFLSREKFDHFKSRLIALPIPIFCEVPDCLEGLSDRCLLTYLRFLTETLETPALKGLSNMTPVIVPDKPIECQPPRLPAEITAMILNKYYEAIFIPGEIEPHSSVTHINDDVFLTEDVLCCHGEELSVLNRRLYNEYKRRYWSENTLVPRIGGSDSLDVLDQIGQDNLSAIRSVRLVMTLHDAHDAVIEVIPKLGDNPNMLDQLIHFHRECMETSLYLYFLWRSKAHTLFALKLEHLTLDFSSAYAPNGEFLGLKFAKDAPKFEHGVPPDLKIIAPSQTKARGIEFLIRSFNR